MVQPTTKRLVTEASLADRAYIDAPGLAKFDWRFPITQYGNAKPATYLTDATMTAGSAVLHSASYSFTSSDVGKVVGVRGAGTVATDYLTLANDGVLAATITSVSGGNATLDQTAATSCSGVPCVFGAPIDTALTAAIAACTASGGGTVYFPAGIWLARNTQLFGSRVSFEGAGRGNSIIYVVKVQTAANLNTTPWLRASGAGSSRYVEINLADFTVDGSFYAATDAYTADMKMLHIAYTQNSTVERIATINNPATALGYDDSINCLIANNVITNPGRLAAPASASGSPGGSGIGVAVGGQGADLSMVIRGNHIKGLWTTAGGVGRSGINLEAASNTTIPDTYYGGVHVTDNFVEGMFNGIVDSGGVGSVISGNTVRKCNSGIRLGTNGITNGSASRDAVVVGNVVENGISGAGFNGVGITVTASGAAKDTRGRTLVADNMIRNNAGFGLRVVGGASFPVDHVTIRGNSIRDSGMSGIQVAGPVNDLVIVGNSITGSGTLGVTGNTEAIDVLSGAVWTDGRLQNNDFYDYATTPTQNNRYDTSGATLTNVAVNGNTGDTSSTGDVYARKTSTTTITNTTVLATVSALSLPMAINGIYELTALIEYTSSTAAGAKFQWLLPTGASINWEISGLGAPSSVRSGTSSASLSGVDGATSIVAFVKGFITMGTTAGNLNLQAAQNTATADSMTVTTKTAVTLRKVA